MNSPLNKKRIKPSLKTGKQRTYSVIRTLDKIIFMKKLKDNHSEVIRVKKVRWSDELQKE